MSYTKGKWERDKLDPDTIVCGNKIIASVASPDDILAYEDKRLKGAKTKEAVTNARRICQCVNGWDDLRALNKQLLEACKWINDIVGTACDGGRAWCALREQPKAKEWANNLKAAIEAADKILGGK